MTASAIILHRNGDAVILDYYRDTVVADGPYSLAIARALRPGAEVRTAYDAGPRSRFARATTDQCDRAAHALVGDDD